MHSKHNNNMIRRIVDVCMTVSLLFLMAYQVTGEVLHEWIGMGMTVLDICWRSGSRILQEDNTPVIMPAFYYVFSPRIRCSKWLFRPIAIVLMIWYN